MNPTILRLSAQALFGRRRGFVMLVIPAILLVLTAIVRLLTDAGTAYPDIVGGLAAPAPSAARGSCSRQ